MWTPRVVGITPGPVWRPLYWFITKVKLFLVL